MGEFSKRIGEIGEDVVNEFLSLIGWTPLLRNFDIPSVDPQKHGKNSHGIDAYFGYDSPMISRTLENILISVKYSKDRYPNSPVDRFKAYYRDLAMAIESFKKSEIRADKASSETHFERIFDRGIIFWLNNVDDDDSEILLHKLSRIETTREFQHDGILLVDNSKISFLYAAVDFIKRRFPQKQFHFTYFNTGLNADDTTAKSGPIMPVQYFASNILPLKVETDSQNNILVLFSRENFEQNELIKLIGLAKNITANFSSHTIIAFPDFNRLQHEQLVQRSLQNFTDSYTMNTLSVENYNSNFRN